MYLALKSDREWMMMKANFNDIVGLQGILSSQFAGLKRHCLRSWAPGQGLSFWKAKEVAFP